MPQASDEKVKAARDALLEALTASETALTDLRGQLGIQLVRSTETSEYRRLTELRTQLVALALQRVEGAASRFVKRLDVNPTSQVAASQAIRVNARLANSWKHGLGGQVGNETVLNGLLVVHSSSGFRTSDGEERVHVLGMAIADGKEGVFGSCSLFEACIRDWATLLAPVLPEAVGWAERAAPLPLSTVLLPANVHATVPLGATVRLAFPPEIVDQLMAESKRRRTSA